MLGRSQRDAVESLWTPAFLHDLKCEAWPLSHDVPHWHPEARLFRRQARRKFTPSMRSKIDMAGLVDFRHAVVLPVAQHPYQRKMLGERSGDATVRRRELVRRLYGSDGTAGV